jgi:hypothetical protein
MHGGRAEHREFDRSCLAAWTDPVGGWRALEAIGNIPPAEEEARYYAMLEGPAMAA